MKCWNLNKLVIGNVSPVVDWLVGREPPLSMSLLAVKLWTFWSAGSVDDSAVEWCIDRWWQQCVLRCIHSVCSLFVGIVIIWCHINNLIFILSYHYYYLFIFLIFSSLLDFFRLTDWLNERLTRLLIVEIYLHGLYLFYFEYFFWVNSFLSIFTQSIICVFEMT